jgi:flagella basal body P-ring formation protein FlgA
MQRFISILMVLSGFSATPAAAAGLTLNKHILLQKDVLTVGDIFPGAGSSSDRALAPAPAVGESLTLKAADIARIATTLHLDWQNDDPELAVTVERDAMLIGTETLIDALHTSDLAGKIDADAEISLQHPADGIVVSGHDMPQLTVTNTSYDPLSQNFTALILASHAGKIVSKTQIAGIATKMAEVPVLTSAIDRGDIIGPADVTVLRLPAKSLKTGIASTSDDILGMAAKRALKANEPLDKSALTAPVLVRRGEIVIVTYRNGPITLSTKARALSNAAKGDLVQLENPTSKKIIEATVTGPQQTTVQMDTTMIING